MNFSITGVVSEDVSTTINRTANAFADAFREQMAIAGLSCTAQLMVFSPVIMPVSLGTIKNESAYRPRQSALMISRNINHDSWMSADPRKRLRLYAEALSQGLGDVSQKVLSTEDLHVLRGAIARAASEAEGKLQ
jgi:hypothetical protein